MVIPSSRTVLAGTPVADDDILPAYSHPIRIEELDDGLFMIVGPSRAGGLLEIGVVAGSELRSSSTRCQPDPST